MATKAPSKIFRYKLSDDIMLDITQFAKIHQFDDRHMYKEAWVVWLSDHRDSVEREVARLTQLNYKGDSIDKMFKAGRYYFREKVQVPKVQETQVPKVQEKQVPKEQKTQTKAKRDYIIMHPATIQAMDTHLRGLINATDFKPALAYSQFCEQHVELLRNEIKRLFAENETITKEKMVAKLKKTYKNRYFILHRT